jgi:hypothetical protein
MAVDIDNGARGRRPDASGKPNMLLDSRIFLRLVILALLIACIPFANRAHAEPIPSGWEARNFEPVGFTSTPGFKLAINRDGDRWFLYTGSRRDGIFVIDVTEPENPITLTNLPTPPNTLETQVSVHDDLLITGMSRTFTSEEMNGSAPDPTSVVQPPTAPDRPYSEGVRLWSLDDPANPTEISRWSAGGLGVHRNSYPGGKYAYLPRQSRISRRPTRDLRATGRRRRKRSMVVSRPGGFRKPGRSFQVFTVLPR